MPVDTSNFIDLEAREVDPEANDSEYSDADLDFVVDDFPEDETNGRAPLWKDLDNWEGDSGPEAMEAIASDIVSWHRSLSSHAHESDDDQDPLPSFEDIIWHVRVKIGSERDAVLSILLKATTGSTVGIRSAFSRDALPGYIYIESPSAIAVSHILNGVPGVARSRKNSHGFVMDVVDLLDRPLLLDMGFKDRHLPITEYSWVQVRSGRYKGDLGFLLGINKSTLICTVYVIPRIHLDRKRKHGRPSQSLFDEVWVREEYGSNSVDEDKNHIYHFKKEFFEQGLLRSFHHLSNLVTGAVDPSEKELDFFRQAPGVWTKAEVPVSPFKIGDRIRVGSGTFIGMVGKIIDVLPMTATVVQEDSNQDVVEVLLSEIQKEFLLGDFVQITQGPERGRSGFVVNIAGRTVRIYTRLVVLRDGVPHELLGSEIQVNSADIEWTSTPEKLLSISSTHEEKNPEALREFYGAQAEDKQAEGSTSIPALRSDMGLNRYRHMEVSIHSGALKQHLGVIQGIHLGAILETPEPSNEPLCLSAQSVEPPVERELLFDVFTTTQATNTKVTYRMEQLREKYTHLPLDKACWIPAHYRQAISLDTIPSPTRTPQPSPIRASTPVTLAARDQTWTATSPPKDDWPIQPPENWLVTHGRRLVLKKLDVRVQGTNLTYPPWQNGKFEGQLGFVVLTAPVHSLESSIIVKTGYAQNRAQLQIRHLVPEVTTERPTYRLKNEGGPKILPILSVPGSCVVIIGPDCSLSMEYIRDYAMVHASPYVLEPGEGLVQIASPGPNWGKHIYIPSTSICRSDWERDGTDWFGTRVL